MEKAYKWRIYPNKTQVDQIELTFKACRWVWNMALETKSAAYKVNQENISFYDLSKMLPRWKAICPWIAQAPSSALVYTLRDLDRAFQDFFRRVKRGEKPGYPKYKSARCGKQSYKVQANPTSGFRLVDERHVRLQKLGVVRCRGLRRVEGRPLSVTVSRTPSGKYYASIACTDVPEPEMPLGPVEVMGIDVGVKDLMVRSDGVRVPNSKSLARYERKLAREQRRLSRKTKGSSNYKKQRTKVARIHERIANQRGDAIHKATTDAVRESQAIAVEDLNVRGMMSNHRIAKSLSDASMSEVHRQLEYKCDWYGRDLVKVDRWFPSSKTCGNCGCVFDDLTLEMREWTCPECGAHNDRDLNAARNLATEGARLLGESNSTGSRG